MQHERIYITESAACGKWDIVDQDGYIVAEAMSEMDARWVVQAHRVASEKAARVWLSREKAAQ